MVFQSSVVQLPERHPVCSSAAVAHLLHALLQPLVVMNGYLTLWLPVRSKQSDHSRLTSEIKARRFHPRIIRVIRCTKYSDPWVCKGLYFPPNWLSVFGKMQRKRVFEMNQNIIYLTLYLLRAHLFLDLAPATLKLKCFPRVYICWCYRSPANTRFLQLVMEWKTQYAVFDFLTNIPWLCTTAAAAVLDKLFLNCLKPLLQHYVLCTADMQHRLTLIINRLFVLIIRAYLCRHCLVYPCNKVQLSSVKLCSHCRPAISYTTQIHMNTKQLWTSMADLSHTAQVWIAE